MSPAFGDVSDGVGDSLRIAAVRRLLAPGLESERLQNTTDLAAELLGARGAQIVLVGEQQTVLAGTGGEPVPGDPVGCAAYDLCAATLRSGAPLVLPGLHAEPEAGLLPPETVRLIGSYLGVPLADTAGTPLGVLCVYDRRPRDWSDRDLDVLARLANIVVSELELRAVTAELERSAAHLELALDAASIGSFDLDLLTRELAWDNRLKELFGYDSEAFVPHLDSFYARVHPEDRDRVAASIERAMTLQGTYASEYRIVLPGQPVRWLSARGRVLADATGTAARLLGAAYDSTALHDSRAHVARVLESMQDAFFSVDARWRFTYLNARAEEVLGRPREELLGRNMWEQFPGAAGDTAFWREYHRAVDTGESVTFEEYYPAPLDKWFEVRGWPDGDGLSVYFHDITARRRAEEERTAAVVAREQAFRERERAWRQAAAAADRLALLGEMTRELTATLDVDETMDRLTRLVVPQFADWAAVTLINEHGQLRHSVARHRDRALADAMDRFAQIHVQVVNAGSNSRTVARTGQPVLHTRTSPQAVSGGYSGDELTGLLERLGLATLMVVPVKSREDVLGVLILAGGPDRAAYTPVDLATATEVGLRAGLAVANAQAYARQRTTAEVLQRSLLTQLPDPTSLALTARYLPAAQEAAVGGDWYDALLLRDGSTVLSLGDVMGHNVDATAAMGQVRTLLRGIAVHTQAPPAGLLSAVDAAMHELEVSTIATAVIAHLTPRPSASGGGDGAAFDLRWANAGHPPPMLLRADGHVEELRGRNLLLGLNPGSPRTQQALTLGDGDTLVLYTDGLVERRTDPSLAAGFARLRHTLAGLAGAPLEELCDELLARMLPSAREDDVALIAARPR